ncbi:MAG TPA: ribonucleotide-diphosphate reductase subunit beta [Conexibacter sp.]|jgi:putative sterol carrier protein|nr:ribonucleotide-diphosphate reductase subunit beta [Conexibacter sp.]
MSLNDVQTPASGTGGSRAADLISYADLYARWEQGNWSAMGLDFTEDARQWREELTDFERKAALWNYALFFWGEDAVADNLSPYIDAAPLEEQKYFLTTQQVDEARHAVFFKRFMHEVCGLGDGTAAGGLNAIKPELTWGFRKVFGRLDTMADELRRDRSPAKLSAAVALYHMVIEATLAQPGQHFITAYLEQRELMPAFREGMTQIARDEQRHIAFGVKLLADVASGDERCRRAVADTLREVTPWGAAVLQPPGWDRNYTEVFGFTLEDIGEEGVTSLATKLRSAGMPLEELPGPPIIPADLTPRETATRGPLLTQAGLLGERQPAAPKDAAAIDLVMDTVRRQLPDTNGTRLTVQFAFTDVEPWVLRIDGGTATAERGSTSKADVTLRTSWDDWLDVAGGRVNPGHAVMRGRLRPRARLSALKLLPAALGGNRR